MKIISKDEFYSLAGKAGVKFAPVKERLEALTIGEALMIEPSDWSSKTGPKQSIYSNYSPGNKSHNTKRFIIKTLPNNQGWAVLRLQ